MANITLNCFPNYSTSPVAELSLKQRLQTCAGNIHYHVFYFFITTTLLKQSPYTAHPVNARILLTVILSVVVSSILFVFLYPLKLTLLGVSLCLKDAETAAISPVRFFLVIYRTYVMTRCISILLPFMSLLSPLPF
ncbi:hypothetical protein NVRI1_00333 [Chlamydia abortus]|nr:hypothetical protein NVRI1_00333 [Chlamydia abortus]